MYVYSSSFSVYVYSNSFSVYLYSTSFSVYVYSNSFSVYVYSNNFSVYVYRNGFSVYVYSNSFSVYLYSNSFSVYVYSNGFSLIVLKLITRWLIASGYHVSKFMQYFQESIKIYRLSIGVPLKVLPWYMVHGLPPGNTDVNSALETRTMNNLTKGMAKV